MTEPTWQEKTDEIWDLFRETAERFKETDKKFKETDEKFKETDEKFKETDERFRRMEAMFTSQWGKLLEALVKPGALDLFRTRGIQVREVFERGKSRQNGETMEIDLLLVDADEVVVVEVKSTLKVDDVRDFAERLPRFPEFFPHYAQHHIYGAVAGLDIAEGADRFAYKQGLFVLRMEGTGLVKIVNDAAFKPHDFSHQHLATVQD
jgi:hypothetical protein